MSLRSTLLLTVSLVCLVAAVSRASQHRHRRPPHIPARRAAQNTGTVTVTVTPGHPANTFLPDRAFGAGVDGLDAGNIAQVYTRPNIKAMLTAGFQPLTYRLRTELGIEAWHWNPAGTWSDAGRQQGYWTSRDRSEVPLLTCNGYRLPRRGSTIDQANNDSYSRLDDGDTQTFWKSNPYLDRHYTGEDNSLHPQWIVIDLEARQEIDALKILWGTPYATQYQVEYWEGVDPIYINENPEGSWKAFPGGIVTHGTGGEVQIKLSDTPVSARFVRLMMTASSESAPPGSQDVRDGLGYSICELYLGQIDATGQFHDILRHGKKASAQTVMYASSADPWHTAANRDKNIEQPGFDLVFRSGLTNGLPVLVPVAPLYDTPENAVAEIRYLKSRGYRIGAIEMGEEPDGQYVTPEDYAALYIQWAEALHKLDPTLRLGGPGFQTSIVDYKAWPDSSGNQSWMDRFLRYLQDHHHLADYNFFSFEWYPFDNVCAPTPPQLADAPELLTGILDKLQRAGLSRSLPWIISEYGYSAFAGQAEVDMAGTLLNAEIVAQFLTLGGTTAYFYGYEPNSLIREMTTCDTWGNLALFLSDEERHIQQPLATYYGARLLIQQWAQSSPRHHWNRADRRSASSQVHRLYPAASDIRNAQGQALVTAYAVHRPDGQWALLLLNKDPQHAWTVQVRFVQPGHRAASTLHGKMDLYQYSSAQYVWHPNKDHGYARPDLPPRHTVLWQKTLAPLRLPAYSLTVIRGQGPAE